MSNLTKKLQKIKLTLMIVLILEVIVFTNTSSSNAYSSNTSSVICGDRILDPNMKLTTKESTELCSLLNKRNDVFMFIRLISDLDRVSERGKDEKYNIDNENYCNIICESHGVCSNALGITVYYDARKVRVSARKSIEHIITPSFRVLMIDNMKPFLKKNDYFKAFEYPINMAIEEFKYRKDGVYSEKYNSYNKNSNNKSNISSSSSDDDLGIFSLLVIIIIIIVLVYLCKSSNSSNNVHNHFSKLNDMIKYDISKKTPAITSTSKCLLCMEFLNKPIEINSSTIPTLVMFSCGHYYHQHCIEKMVHKNKADDHCLMCDEPTAVVNKFTNLSESNNGEFIQHVTEKNVVNVMDNFNNIYGDSSMKSYYKSYESSDIKVMNSYSFPIWWLTHKDYIPETNTHSSSSTNYFSSSTGNYGTTGGDYSDNNNNNDYGTSGGDY